MPRFFHIWVLSTMLTSTVLAQTQIVPGVISPVPAPPIVMRGAGFSQVDNNGNLLVFETRYVNMQSGTSIPGVRRAPIPSTRLTVVLNGGGPPVARDYPGVTFQLAGAGQWGTYAILTTVVQDQNRVSLGRRLIAINAGVSGASLPMNAADFVSTGIADGVGHVEIVRDGDKGPDTLYAVAKSGGVILLNAVPSTASGGSVTIYKYAGGQFSSTRIDLP